MADEQEVKDDQDEAAEKARSEQEDVEAAKKEMEELEQGDPPGKLEDWPGGKAKYQTYGGPEGETSYEEGPTAKLGPSSLRHHEGGKVTIEGEEVDNPEEYKGEPIPGGPSDPDAPPDPAMIGQDDEDREGGGDGDDDDRGDEDDDRGDDDRDDDRGDDDRDDDRGDDDR
jgi:hypothetical protein